MKPDAVEGYQCQEQVILMSSMMGPFASQLSPV